MKKYLIVVLFSLFGLFAKAQSDLHFSQVLTYSGTLSGSGIQSSPVWIVPQGKVWKIESKTRTGITNLSIIR